MEAAANLSLVIFFSDSNSLITVDFLLAPLFYCLFGDGGNGKKLSFSSLPLRQRIGWARVNMAAAVAYLYLEP